MKKVVFDWNEYARLSRAAGAEGIVMLENKNNVLPLNNSQSIAVFGRAQLNYYKCGMGSGGMVNTPYTVGIVEGMKNAGMSIDEELYSTYKEWEKTHPYDKGHGWATEWWSQEEMELSDELIASARKNADVAVIVIGRSAGEDRDSEAVAGSYLLQELEEVMLSKVCDSFEKTIVLLNVGGIIDMSWVKKYEPSAVLYVWQGGCEGGNAVADVLTGKVNPSGKLADTIANDLSDYPSTANFGDKVRSVYKEDVYVGYRYFESVNKEVLYPFGYGLSYTNFDIEVNEYKADDEKVMLSVWVKNIGEYEGKEVVQVYYNPAQGKLDKPNRNLIRYAKTDLLKPGQEQILNIEFSINEMSSYDDGGYTGNKSCYVLEPGKYEIYVGNSVRNITKAGCVDISSLRITEKCSEALAPTYEYERMVVRDGEISYSKTPNRTVDYVERILTNRPDDRECTGDKGYKLVDVYDGKVELDDFLDQLSNEELICMSRGEGMCSPKVTPGIAGTYGGVTEELLGYGIPIGGVSDGPSGIRMDNGTMAFQTCNGAALACSFNDELVEQLFEYLGMELRINKIDSLLGPGLNIHRNPLNGRNFEYFSEDPYLTGSMAVAELKGMHKAGVTGTIKHFICNNQETERHSSDSVVSERAAREIYLKAFEMAVKDAGAFMIMTTYCPVNGIWTAGNYDLNTVILRNEWKYEGLVMTDWWAKVSDDKGNAGKEKTEYMIRSQNDVYMVTADSKKNAGNDTAMQGLKSGIITRGELLRNAANICKAVMKSLTMKRFIDRDDMDIEQINRPESETSSMIVMKRCEFNGEKSILLSLEGLSTEGGALVQFPIWIDEPGRYRILVRLRSPLSDLAQINTTVSINKTVLGTMAVNGTDNEWITKELEFGYQSAQELYIHFYFGQSGIEIGEIKIEKKSE